MRGRRAASTGTLQTHTETLRNSLASGSSCTPSAVPTSSWPPSLASLQRFSLMAPTRGASTVPPEYAKAACEKSLKKLGVDYIDLYYAHRVDGKTPIEKTVQALAELKR
ncbi:uncharacterized protein TrAtP1_013072 [Trichoderma atroviride]|uniref:uncharacterized protein n=1 Tax=Hypocrea atroviridis TaxID=63577 RepID=UPI00331D05DA|nr:hypothetical protein TrAtP1_013072 [Trichoderma atroviride]